MDSTATRGNIHVGRFVGGRAKLDKKTARNSAPLAGNGKDDMGNIDSLPKWARYRMTQLERERDHYKSLLESKTSGKEVSRQWARFFTDTEFERFYLPTGTPVEFDLGSGLVEVAIPWRNKTWADELEIRCIHRGGLTEMRFIPQVSNVMRLKLGKD